jgi:hypothetical protein
MSTLNYVNHANLYHHCHIIDISINIDVNIYGWLPISPVSMTARDFVRITCSSADVNMVSILIAKLVGYVNGTKQKRSLRVTYYSVVYDSIVHQEQIMK